MISEMGFDIIRKVIWKENEWMDLNLSVDKENEINIIQYWCSISNEWYQKTDIDLISIVVQLSLLKAILNYNWVSRMLFESTFIWLSFLVISFEKETKLLVLFEKEPKGCKSD